MPPLKGSDSMREVVLSEAAMGAVKAIAIAVITEWMTKVDFKTFMEYLSFAEHRHKDQNICYFLQILQKVLQVDIGAEYNSAIR